MTTYVGQDELEPFRLFPEQASETAARLDPQNPRYAYVLGVAQWETGRREEAIATLQTALLTHPGNPELEAALASYRQQMGDL